MKEKKKNWKKKEKLKEKRKIERKKKNWKKGKLLTKLRIEKKENAIAAWMSSLPWSLGAITLVFLQESAK